MPGRRNTNFRKGDLAEKLGIVLLQSISVVAEVSRSEDVGADAICTLLRPSKDGNLYAEDGFLVQIKSMGEKSMAYKTHGLAWFEKQDLPLFIGKVCLKSGTIALYSTLFILQAIKAIDPKEMTIHFGPSNQKGWLKNQNWNPWTTNGDNGDVWLGPPVLEWNITTASNKDWPENAYKILKAFLQFAKTEKAVTNHGHARIASWGKNIANSARSERGVWKGKPNIFVGEETKAMLLDMAFCAGAMSFEKGKGVVEAIKNLKQALLKHGINIDEDNVLRITEILTISKPTK